MEENDIQTRRQNNQRRILLEFLSGLPELLEPGTNFPKQLNRRFRENRRFGSRDRRLYRELIYTYLRYEPWLKPLSNAEDKALDRLITLAAPTPDIVTLYPTIGTTAPNIEEENRHRLIGKTDSELSELVPEWFKSHLKRDPDAEDWIALFSRPPLWLRVQQGNPESILPQLSVGFEKSRGTPTPHPQIPYAIQCPPDFPVQETDCYTNGQIEIQDISSQVLLQLLEPSPTGRWLDACAGAGGKTLQLAKQLGKSGHVFAYDPRSRALDELDRRTRRSGLRNVSRLRERPTDEVYDGVLVDAPCSGSGTWRRHPYLIRQTRESDVFAAAKTQIELLEGYSHNVAPRGTLVYCTCSLSRYENQEVGQKFLHENPDFELLPLANKFGLMEDTLGITVYPKDFNGDGLYVASFRRRSS